VDHGLIFDSKSFERGEMATQEEIDTFLAHHGVKGMHWGVHRQRLLELHTAVASGHGTKGQKLAVASQMSVYDAIKHKGSVTSYSTEQAKRLRAERDRLESGNGTRKDKINAVGSLGAEDLARKALNKPRTARA
jgi:hypothetical protein